MKKIDLTEGKVAKVLIALALPIMGSSLLQFTYNLIDMLWIGGLGSQSVASIGSSSFFINLGNALHALIVVGTGIKVSHHIGKEDQEGAKDYIRLGMILSSILGLIYAVILIGCGKHLIGFFKLENQVVAHDAYVYLAWNAPILFFSFFNNLFSRVFASLGNSKSAFKINAIGLLLNIILDPILIYGLRWGITGAAVATLIANIVMLILYLKIGRDFLKFKWSGKLHHDQISEVVKLGMPIACQRILFTLINIMLARMIATFGAEAVAAQKIGAQIEAVTYMVTGGLNGAVASFIGQNYGARKDKRLHKGYQTALGIGIVYAAISSFIFLLLPRQLAGLFVKESETITMAAGYLSVIAYSQIFNAMEMVSNGFFTGIGKPKIPSLVSIMFTALRLPIAYIGMQYFGVDAIWWSITLTTILKGIVLVGAYLKNKKGKKVVEEWKS